MEAKHRKRKIIAPVIITLIAILYYLIIGIKLYEADFFILIKIAALIAPLAITIMSVAALVERVNEINKGEEDDLGKY